MLCSHLRHLRSAAALEGHISCCHSASRHPASSPAKKCGSSTRCALGPASLPQGYQFNHLVQRTDEMYPNLWVASGSGASQLGVAMGMDANFVTGGWELGLVVTYRSPMKSSVE